MRTLPGTIPGASIARSVLLGPVLAFLVVGILLPVPAPAQPVSVEPRAPAPAVPTGASDAYPGLAWVHLHRANASVPGPRIGAGLSDDPSAGGLLLFGGCGPAECPMGDTWWYAAGTWTNLTANLTLAPSPRYDEGLAYDADAGGVLLFGGCGPGGAVLGDSWLFADGTWRPIGSNGSGPPARCGAAATSDPTTGGVDLFGGRSSEGALFGDLWSFNASGWTELAGIGGPAARANASLAYDPSVAGPVLFGGIAANGSVLGDTWTFENHSWEPLDGPEAPPARASAAFTEVPSLGGDLLVGGADGPVLRGDAWLIANGTWTNLTAVLPRSPAPRTGATAAFDSFDGYALMEGGRIAANDVRNDTWAFVLPLAATLRLPIGIVPGALTELGANVSGGLPPYHYNWTLEGNGSPIREEAPYVAFPTFGSFPVHLEVTDQRGVSASLNGTISVQPLTLSVTLAVLPARVSLGGTVRLVANVSGGVPPYVPAFSGLPSGCSPSTNLTVLCTPRLSGSYLIAVSVRDQRGAPATASAALVVGSALAEGALPSASGAAPLLDRWGWILVPPLGAAVGMAAYASYVSYRFSTRPDPEPRPRPDCYVPPEWSETPTEFGAAQEPPTDAPSAPPR